MRTRFSLQTLLMVALLAGGAAGLCAKWEPWALRRKFDAYKYLYFQTFVSPDGRKVVLPENVGTAGKEEAGPAHIIDFESGAEHIIPDSELVFAPDSRSCVSIGKDSLARIWDPESGERRATLCALPQHIECARYSPDSRSIVTCAFDAEHQKISLWDTETGALRDTLDGRVVGSFSPDSALVSTIDGPNVDVWETDTGKLRLSLTSRHQQTDDRKPETVRFSPDSQLIVMADDDALLVADVQTGTVISTLAAPIVSILDFSPDSQWIAAETRERTVRIWKIPEGKFQEMNLLSDQQNASSARFLTDGRFAFNGKVRDLNRGTEEAQPSRLPLQPHEELIYGGDDGRWDVTQRGDTVRVWDNRKLVRTLENFGQTSSPDHLEFSPSGERFVAQGNDCQSACFWKLDTGQCQQVSVPSAEHTCAFFAHFSSDEQHIVTSWCYGGEIFLFDRRRAEGMAGLCSLPEFWLTAVFGLALLWKFARAARPRLAVKRASIRESSSQLRSVCNHPSSPRITPC